MHCSYVAIILFSTGLYNSAFLTNSFGKLGLRLSEFLYFLSVPCSEFNVISKDLSHLYNHADGLSDFALTL